MKAICLLLLTAGTSIALPSAQVAAPMRLRGGVSVPVLSPKTMSKVTAGINLGSGLGCAFLPEEFWVDAYKGKAVTSTERFLTEVFGKESLSIAAVVWALGRGESLCTAGLYAAAVQIVFILRCAISKDYAEFKQPKELLFLWSGLLAVFAFVAGKNGAGLVDGDAFIRASSVVFWVLTALPDLLTPISHCQAYGLSQITPRAVALARTNGVLRSILFGYTFMYKESPMKAMTFSWVAVLANVFFGFTNQDFQMHGVDTSKAFGWVVLSCYMIYSGMANFKK